MDILLGGQYWSLEDLKKLDKKGLERIREEIANLTALMDEDIILETPVTGEMIALLTVLSLFTVVGSVGNGLVLFVFSRVRDKTTAQLFILALALIDLFTCMVIIPFTMFVEYTRYDIKYDFLCKLYQFLITSKVPLSAFIMVAIAFDRYFCICHPLRKIITPWRTKVIIVSLTLFASILGVMTSLAYGVYQVFNTNDPEMYNGVLNSSFTSGTESIKDWAKLGEDPITKNDVTMTVERRLKDYLIKRNFTAVRLQGNIKELVYIGICAPNEILLGWGFVSIYQKCYTALFLICLVIVGILYGMIYRFIGMRRNKKLQQKLVLCAYVNGENGCGEAGTRTTMLNGNGHDNHNDDDKYACNALGFGAGGVYIGGCSSPPSFTKTVSVNLVSSICTSVSFNGDAESGKPGKEGQKNQKQDESPTGIKIGNSQSRLTAPNSAENTESCTPANTTQTVCKTSENKQESKEGHMGKDVQRKSPSPTILTSGRKKVACVSQRRPHSMEDDISHKTDNSCIIPLRKRRASSPFKREVHDSSSGCKIEMKGLRSRRESEPFKCLSQDVSPSSGVEEDWLTVGSRSSYLGPYPHIDEDCVVFKRPEGHNEIPDVITTSIVSELESDDVADSSTKPLIADSNIASDRLLPKQANDSETDDPRLPLLQETVKENDKAKNSLPRKEYNISSDRLSKALSGAGADSPDSEVFQPANKEDSEKKVLTPSTLNNRCPQSGSNQQALLTSYVRNLTPACSTSSSNLSPPKSCSDFSRRSTMEAGVARSPSLELPHRQTTESSRRSTMESGARRPATGRKKRWQHFRCKNASIKSCHNRQHHKAASSLNGGRRSIMSYDADRLREENRAANARTALMLFTVTLVFVVAFLPAWLMAHRIVPTQLMVFYLYFTYNVANPFIYAFMNAIFKEHLRMIIRCRRGN